MEKENAFVEYRNGENDYRAIPVTFSERKLQTRTSRLLFLDDDES
jgi:hypothetical protein